MSAVSSWWAVPQFLTAELTMVDVFSAWSGKYK